MSDRPMPSSFDDDIQHTETGRQKLWRKLREEPLIPLGTGLTCLALYNAWRAMRKGDHAQVQRMFRARIGAQAFTVCAVVAGGSYYGADRKKRAELTRLENQRKAEERHQKWLHELEVRDDEEKKLQDHMRRRRERQQAKQAEEALKPADASKGEGEGVMGALSQTDGWLGTGKKPQEGQEGKQPNEEADKPNK